MRQRRTGKRADALQCSSRARCVRRSACPAIECTSCFGGSARSPPGEPKPAACEFVRSDGRSPDHPCEQVLHRRARIGAVTGMNRRHLDARAALGRRASRIARAAPAVRSGRTLAPPAQIAGIVARATWMAGRSTLGSSASSRRSSSSMRALEDVCRAAIEDDARIDELATLDALGTTRTTALVIGVQIGHGWPPPRTRAGTRLVPANTVRRRPAVRFCCRTCRPLQASRRGSSPRSPQSWSL